MQRTLSQTMLEVLSNCAEMTIATVRPDGWPQATVVAFVQDGLTLYFACGAGSQKAANIDAEPRVSVAITPPYKNWMDIVGLSMAATAERVTLDAERDEVQRLMVERFPQIREIPDVAGENVAIYRVRPSIVSILDYSQGFGHTDLVAIHANDIAEASETMRHHWLVPAPNRG